MFVRAAILAATMAAVCASAATKDEDLDKDSGQAFGNNQITWQMFNAGGPAVAFAVSAQAVFFANGTDVVGTIDATKYCHLYRLLHHHPHFQLIHSRSPNLCPLPSLPT